MVEYDGKKRLDWPLGVVKEVYPGRDGKCRSALVKTKTGEFTRPIQRLFLLEMGSSSTEKEETAAVKEESAVEKTSRFGRKLVQPDRLKY